jgi:adenosyl cobinamide kinase/adenosyl cobinamide phosphate guanylyltransferase
MTLVVVLGGVRSGKSALAVEIGRRWPGPVSLIATAEVRDEEMRERIERHRRERPSHWSTVEAPRELASCAPWRSHGLVIVDCLTLWISNLIEAERDAEAIVEAARELVSIALARQAPTIVVSNEVGLGIIPATPLGRRFADLLGTVNRLFVERADPALFVVAGQALRLEPVPIEEILA